MERKNITLVSDEDEEIQFYGEFSRDSSASLPRCKSVPLLKPGLIIPHSVYVKNHSSPPLTRGTQLSKYDS